MKKTKYYFISFALVITILSFMFSGCTKTSNLDSVTSDNDVSDAATGTSSLNFQNIVLTANTTGYHALHTEYTFINAWGISSNDEGEIWVSAADAGLSYVFNNRGNQIYAPIFIPSHKANSAGSPTGNVNNATNDFIIPGTSLPAEFLFASEDGTVSAFNDSTGGHAAIVADRNKAASYKGIAIAEDKGHNFLYTTNFKQKRIDVFDKNFKLINNKPFNDPDIPAAYAPFNIRNIGNQLYVTYALRTADGEDDSTGAGFGFIDVYKPDGSLIKRLATRGHLNAPWGITAAPKSLFNEDDILVGNFGDGRINVFDMNGNFKGQLQSNGKPLQIDGLWGLESNIPKTLDRQIYYTAGPNDEEDGLFGFIVAK